MSNRIKIQDFTASELDVYVRLTGTQLRNRLEPEKGILIAESPTVIDVALDGGCVPLSILIDERLATDRVEAVIARCEKLCPGIPIYTAGREILRNMTGFELTRGMLCAMKRPLPKNAEEICRDAHRVAVLENVTDSTNIGAIFRSAAALGVDAVLLSPTCCDPLCRRAVRVSMGTVFLIPFATLCDSSADWVQNGMKSLHSMGFKTAAMALSDKSVPINDKTLASEKRLAIVLGTEGDGLAQSTIADCDYTVKIPMYHSVDSLNVAAASAVAFWELRKKN